MSKTPSPPKITTRPNSNARRVQAIDGYLARIFDLENQLKKLKQENKEDHDALREELLDKIDVLQAQIRDIERDITASEETVENNPQSQTPNNNNDDFDDFDDDFDDFYGSTANRTIQVPETPPNRQPLKY